jgi:hypothetical protein
MYICNQKGIQAPWSNTTKQNEYGKRRTNQQNPEPKDAD